MASRSKIMRLAHEIAKSTGGNYSVNFSESLKIAWKYYKSNPSVLKGSDRLDFTLLCNFVQQFTVETTIDNTDYSLCKN